MNKKRREALKEAISLLEEASIELNSILEEEQEAYDNIPESLQDSERGERMQDNIGVLECTIEEIERLTCDIEEIINN